MLVFAHTSLEPKSGSADLAAELTRCSSARVGTLFFLADLLSSRLCSQLLSKCFVPLHIAALQAGRSWAKASHSSTGMLQALRVGFSTSLYRFLCPPLCRLPVESSAWNSCFGSLLSSMRVACPDQRSCAWFNMASMPVSSA